MILRNTYYNAYTTAYLAAWGDTGEEISLALVAWMLRVPFVHPAWRTPMSGDAVVVRDVLAAAFGREIALTQANDALKAEVERPRCNDLLCRCCARRAR